MGGLLAIGALGLAFGNAGGPEVQGPDLASAYRTVMFAAAVLAGCSAVIAALTIRPAHR